MNMMQSGTNFILLITAAIALLLYDLKLFLRGKTTFSETVWTINQRTIWLAYIAGLICGHLFTVPG